jgi:3-methyladenine DNA glycosylase AlkD
MIIGIEMEDTEIIQWVVEELEKLVDRERKEWSKGYYPSSMRIIGVKVPDQRKVRKELSRKLKERSPEDVISLSKDLVETNIFECQQVAFELLDKNRKARDLLTLKDLMDLRKGLDNWVSVDTYSGWLAGVAWREGAIPDELIKEWATSDDKWERRTAVVCTIALNQKARGGTGDVKRTLWVCRMVASDKDDMVAKALSWALRELSKIEKEPVIDFLNEFNDVLPGRVKREVSRKLETGRKYG